MLNKIIDWLLWVLWGKREYTRYAFDKMMAARAKGAACQVRIEDVWFGQLMRLAKKADVQVYSVVNEKSGQHYYSMFDPKTLRLQALSGDDQTELLPTTGPNAAKEKRIK